MLRSFVSRMIWGSPLRGALQEEILDPKWTVLDVGCGTRPFAGFDFPNPSLCLDAYGPYLDQVKGERLCVQWDAADGLQIFRDSSYDVVLLLDVLEHLKRTRAVQLLIDATHIARKRVLVYTPSGWLAQDGDVSGLGGDEWQTHRCAFAYSELKGLGFLVKKWRTRSAQHGEYEVLFGALRK